MIKTLISIAIGFIIGLIFSKNGIVIHVSDSGNGNSARAINQFVIIFGIGNSSNDCSIHVNDESDKND